MGWSKAEMLDCCYRMEEVIGGVGGVVGGVADWVWFCFGYLYVFNWNELKSVRGHFNRK